MWQTHWGYTTAMVVLRRFRAFIPLVTLWVGNLIIDMADHIIVLQNGTVVEDETHATLVVQGGPYATLFALQAEGYRWAKISTCDQRSSTSASVASA